MRNFSCPIQMVFLIVLSFMMVLVNSGCEAKDEQKKELTDQKGAELTSPLAVETAGKAGDIMTNSIGMKLVYIAPGEFMMGSPDNESDRNNDETQHKVTLTKGFYLGQYEVTQEQYEQVMGNNPSFFKGANLPVEMVSWDNAMEFCKRLNQKEGKTYTLPTEAQWEYACRAGTTTPFYFGETISADLANYDGNYTYGNDSKGVYREKTTEVGSFSPNRLGLYDTHGNVWEWCADWYGDYPSGLVVNPTGPTSGSFRVLRGGGWNCNPLFCRAAIRTWNTPDGAYFNYGFRVVCVGGLD